MTPAHTPHTVQRQTIKLGRDKTPSRIWLQGKALLASGFDGGSSYSLTWTETALILTLAPSDHPGAERKADGTSKRRKVTPGSARGPIVDITGGKVKALGWTDIVISYYRGMIVVSPAPEAE